MLRETEETLVQYLAALLAAIGAGTVAYGVARLAWPQLPADAYVAVFGAACGAPLILAFVVVMVGWSRRLSTRNRVEELQAQTALVQAQARLAPLPVLVQSRQVDREEQRRSHMAAQWQVFDRRLIAAGDAYGFDCPTLTKLGLPTKVTSEAAWKFRVPTYVSAGILYNKPGQRTEWAEGWDLHRWNEERAWMLLPHPDTAPPEIEPPPYSAAVPSAKPRAKRSKAAETTLEGTATPVD
jgi:hypothetical protein